MKDKEYFAKLFVNKKFTVDHSTDFPDGFVSEDWKAIVNMYFTLKRFGIPMGKLKIDYDREYSDNMVDECYRIRITKVQYRTTLCK